MHSFGGPDEPPPVEGVFLSRPNRFIIIAETGGKKVRVHCPNPGRIWEILHPGRKLLLTPASDPDRKTPYSLAAACYKGKTIPMNAARSNRVAEELILPLLFPEAESIRREYTLPPQIMDSSAGEEAFHKSAGRKTRSRFDFMVEDNGEKHLIEVKSCTLTEEGAAMFPDAPTERGRRHVEELEELDSRGEYRGHVIFVLHHRDTERFIPNYHTDPLFAAALQKASKTISLHAASVETDADGRVKLIDPDLPIEFGPIKAAEADRGFYLLLFRLTEELIEPGAPLLDGLTDGESFKTGWYVLLEEAECDLRKQLSRRMGPRKKDNTPAALLCRAAAEKKGVPVYTRRPMGEEAFADFLITADEMSTTAKPWLFFRENPLFNEDFTKVLFYYRHNKSLN